MRDTLNTSDVTHGETSDHLIVETRTAEGDRVTQLVDARSYVARSVGIMALVGVALIHLLDSGSQLQSTPYIFGLYVLLMIGSLIVATILLNADSKIGWAGAGLLAGVTMIGYILSRTVGLPGSSDDIGNWGDQLGTASLFFEGCLVVLSIYRLVVIHHESRPRS